MPRYIETSAAPKPFSNYSQAVEIEPGARVVHVSGQVGITLEGKIPESEEQQHHLAWANLLSILKSQNMTAENLVECHAYITNPASVVLYRTVRDRILQGAKPASTLVVVTGLADPRLVVEIAAVASAP